MKTSSKEVQPICTLALWCLFFGRYVTSQKNPWTPASREFSNGVASIFTRSRIRNAESGTDNIKRRSLFPHFRGVSINNVGSKSDRQWKRDDRVAHGIHKRNYSSPLLPVTRAVQGATIFIGSLAHPHRVNRTAALHEDEIIGRNDNMPTVPSVRRLMGQLTLVSSKYLAIISPHVPPISALLVGLALAPPLPAHWLTLVCGTGVVLSVGSAVHYENRCHAQRLTMLSPEKDEERWALVTGASSALGSELARQLSARGFNLVLVSTSNGPVEDLQLELTASRALTMMNATSSNSSSAAAEFQSIVLTYDRMDSSALDTLFSEVRIKHNLSIDLLVSASEVEQSAVNFLETSNAIDEQVLVDIIAQTRLIKACAADMMDRKQGRILLMSSILSLSPSPGAAVYASAKAYISSLGQTLNHELSHAGISVTTAVTGYIQTEAKQPAAATWLPSLFKLPGASCRSSQVVKSSLDATWRGDPLVMPGFNFRVWAHVLRVLLPREVCDVVTQSTFAPVAVPQIDQFHNHQTNQSGLLALPSDGSLSSFEEDDSQMQTEAPCLNHTNTNRSAASPS